MYQFNSRVRYSELNHSTGSLAISSIINYFQDCSTFQSEDIKVGLNYLNQHKRVWLLNSWQLELYSDIHLGDYITIGTWPYSFKGFYGYRNFIMKNDKEEVLAVANSIWVYYNTETCRPVKVGEDNAGYTLEPPYHMEYSNRKIDILDNPTKLPEFTVTKSNLDSNNHVNNGQYIKMAEDYLPNDFIIKTMRVEYRKQAVLHNIIVPYINMKDKCFQVILSDEQDSIYAIIEFIGR